MIIIRSAIEKDLDAILTIYNDAILNTTAVYDYNPHTPKMRFDWFIDKKAHNFPVLVAEKDGIVGGFATYGPFRNWAAYQHTAEHSVYVHPDFRGQGIAKLLLKRIIETAQSNGVHTLIAGIDSDNAVSIYLHQQFGFKEVALFHEVGYKFGRWLNLQCLQLILGEKKSS